MSVYRHKPIDLRAMRTRSINERTAKVSLKEFAKIYSRGSGLSGWLDCLPHILAGDQFHMTLESLHHAHATNRAILWGLGGHVVKCGLSPVLIDLLKRGFVTAFAMNGAAAIHDFEIALVGSTSEDVDRELSGGDFGISRETGEWMNEAIVQGVSDGLGIGESLGRYMVRYAERFPQADFSLLAAAYQHGIPVTVHIAVGTDTIHNHPAADGSALGRGSLQDCRLLTSLVADLHDGGVYLNCGSAVVLPEVFLKTVGLVRNLGRPLERFTTVDLDFLQHYRPTQNVVKRPTLKSGRGISLTGHHELMIPLLAASLIETG